MGSEMCIRDSPVIVSEIILPFKSIPLIKNEFEEVFVLDEIFTLEPR